MRKTILHVIAIASLLLPGSAALAVTTPVPLPSPAEMFLTATDCRVANAQSVINALRQEKTTVYRTQDLWDQTAKNQGKLVDEVANQQQQDIETRGNAARRQSYTDSTPYTKSQTLLDAARAYRATIAPFIVTRYRAEQQSRKQFYADVEAARKVRRNAVTSAIETERVALTNALNTWKTQCVNNTATSSFNNSLVNRAFYTSLQQIVYTRQNAVEQANLAYSTAYQTILQTRVNALNTANTAYNSSVTSAKNTWDAALQTARNSITAISY